MISEERVEGYGGDKQRKAERASSIEVQGGRNEPRSEKEPAAHPEEKGKEAWGSMRAEW